MDLKTLFLMFIPFTCEVIISMIMLLRHPLRFRFKPYISIPIGLLIAFASSLAVIFGLRYLFKPEDWKEWLNILSYTIPVIGIYFAFFFAYKIEPTRLLLNLAVAYTFQSMAYQFVNIVFETGLQGQLVKWFGEEWYQQYYSIFYNICSYTLKIGVYVACYFLMARSYKKYSKYIFTTLNIVILGIIVFLVINVANVFISLHVNTMLWWDGNLKLVLYAILIIFCIVFDSLIVGGFIIAEHREESLMIQMALNAKIREQEMTENNINFINMKCHDLRKELRRLKEQKSNLTDEDFCLLEESLNFYDSSVKTGNVNIDTLIQDKLIYCNSLGIEFTSLIDGEAFKRLERSDTYFLLVNIIDNAIEAVEQIEEKEKRTISLTASEKQGMLVIEETNYFSGSISFNNDGSIKTTKQNTKYHGYGTKSIAYITRKYEGKVTYDTKDDIFMLRIVI